jgi:quinol monooxygenase YgiN
MVIVAGHITVEPQQRESYVAGCVSVVDKARGAAGCLDFAITADLIDPGRVNIFERWIASGRQSLPQKGHPPWLRSTR